jgi:glutamyl-tRNA reductase
MLISIAVDFRHADVATRERFHLSEERVARLYEAPFSWGVEELVAVATCNRSELYAWTAAEDPTSVDHAVTGLARRWMGSRHGARALLTVIKRRAGAEVARHVLRVASGLESQVLGDAQILGQTRAAYRAASRSHAAGPVLHRLFDTALRTGKRTTTETALSAGRNSIGAEAALLAHRRFGRLTHARVVIVGCGKTGERAARQLAKLGAHDLVLINRTADRAVALGEAIGGRVAPYDARHLEIAMADVAIVATAAEAAIVEASPLRLGRVNCGTNDYPLLLIDLGVPRNVDPAAAALPGVSLVDIDQLHPPLVAAEQMRSAALPSAEAIVESELQAFGDWLAAGAAREAIRPLREALTAVCTREVAYAAGDEVARRASERIVAKLLARPMQAMRRAIAHGEPVEPIAATLLELFDAHTTATGAPLSFPHATDRPRAYEPPRLVLK